MRANKKYGLVSKTVNLICGIVLGFIICLFWISTKSLLDARHTDEYLNLLRCCEERYEYCPYCGHALVYKYTNPLNKEVTQELLLELGEESDISISNTGTSTGSSQP